MRKISILIALALYFPVQAQNSVEQVLSSIEQNNKEIQASTQLVKAQKLETRTGISLPDPTVSYEYMKGNTQELGKTGELTISQSFDFPTVYSNRLKLSRLKSTGYDWQGSALRQSVLLQSKEVCLELILLNKQKNLLEERLKNAEQLSSLFAKRVESGDANMLEKNKIDLELLNVKTEFRMNESSRRTALQKLQALNGNVPVNFDGTTYSIEEALPDYEIYKQMALASNIPLKTLAGEQAIAKKQINLSRSEWFPKFELGYRRNTGPGEQFNGVLFGISIPLYENRNKIRQAKAMSGYSDLQMDNMSLQIESELRSLYDQSLSLKTSMTEYNVALQAHDNLSLLYKALEAGQISMIEYFVEAATVYQSMQNYLELENEYYKTMAQIWQFKL